MLNYYVDQKCFQKEAILVLCDELEGWVGVGAREHWLPLSVPCKLLSPGNGPRSRDALKGTAVSPLPAGMKGRGSFWRGAFQRPGCPCLSQLELEAVSLLC